MEGGEPALVDVVDYPAECVNPPEGVKSLDWIRSGNTAAAGGPYASAVQETRKGILERISKKKN